MLELDAEGAGTVERPRLRQRDLRRRRRGHRRGARRGRARRRDPDRRGGARRARGAATTGRSGSTCAATSGRRAPSPSTGRRGWRASGRRRPVEVPTEPGEPPPAHFSIASTLGPLVLAVVMVAITKDIRFALFSLLSPVIGVGTYYESKRRRNTKTSARDQRSTARSSAQLQAARRRRRRARARAAPGAQPRPGRGAAPRGAAEHAAVGAAAPRTTTSCSLYAGLGDLAWQPPLEPHGGKLPPKVAADARGRPAAQPRRSASSSPRAASSASSATAPRRSPWRAACSARPPSTTARPT